MNIKDADRAAFEAVTAPEYGCNHPSYLQRDQNGYVDPFVRAEWQGWQNAADYMRRYGHSADAPRPDGLQLRDHFAMQAIPGVLPGSMLTDGDVEDRARWAYRMADAMLKIRGEK